MFSKSHVSRSLGRLAGISLLAACLLAENAGAAVTVTWQEVGLNVTATYSGSWDIAILTLFSNETAPFVGVNIDEVVRSFIALGGKAATVYDSDGGNFTFQTKSVAADDLVGNAFGFTSEYVYVPQDYVSGTSLSGVMTFNNKTLDDIFPSAFPENLVVGRSAGAGNELIYNTIVPEPGVAILGMVGILALCGRSRTKTR
jgi:hypothetical protein